MKILLISHGYYPQVNPRAFRWTALAEFWAAVHGAEIDVIALQDALGLPIEIRGGVSVHRVGFKFTSRLRATAAATPGLGAPTRRGLMGALKWIYRNTWRKILWPDYAGVWFFPARQKALELCKQKKYDCVISVSHPFTGHLVGWSIKRKYRELRWLADIGDPFAFLEGETANNPWLYKQLNYAVEKSMLEHADIITVTTDPTRELYRAKLSVPENKIFTIPPLLSVVSDEKVAPPKKVLGKTLVYLGTLYPKIRSPEPLLRIFTQLLGDYPNCGYELHFYGSINGCESMFKSVERWMGKNIFVHGLVSRAEAAIALQGADILVNLGNETKFQLPSKTVESFASGKPILNVIHSEQDSSRDFFADYPSILNVLAGDTRPSVLQHLHEFLEHAKPVQAEWIKARIGRYSLPQVSSAYWELLK